MKKYINIGMAILVLFMYTIIVDAQTCKVVNLSNKIEGNCISKELGKKYTKDKIFENGIKQKTVDLLVKNEYIGEKEIIEYHEMEVTYIIPQIVFEEKNMFDTVGSIDVYAAGGSSNKNDEDKTGTIKCTSTITYTISKKNSKDYIKMTKASGKLKSLTGFTGSSQGSGISIVSNKVVIGRDGINSSGKWVSNSKTITCENKPCSLSYTPSWSAVGYSAGTNVYKMGCQQTVKLKRGNSTWTFQLKNYV